MYNIVCCALWSILIPENSTHTVVLSAGTQVGVPIFGSSYFLERIWGYSVYFSTTQSILNYELELCQQGCMS